ncbi:MAG: hypothetical protein QW282_00020 [Nitrososphaerales archaeon]
MKGAKNKQTYLKISSFIAVLLLLAALTQIRLPQKALAEGFVPLPDEYRDAVTVETINGAVQAILAVDEHGDVGQLMSEYEMWKISEGAVLRPSAVNTQGCSSEYINNLQINFTITHTILERVVGTVKVEICNYETGFVYDSRLLLVNFIPREPVNKIMKFSVVTLESNTAFLIKITFPTAEELAYEEPKTRQVSLLEYMLYQIGITPH